MSVSMPQWLADWLGIPAGTAADGASWRLDSSWSWPPWATVTLLLAAAVFIAMLYARESTSAGRPYRILLSILRFVAAVIVLIMLAQWTLAVRLTGPPAIAVLIDRSASMAIADEYTDEELPPPIRERLVASGLSEPFRLNLAKLIALENDAAFLKALADRYRLYVYFVAADVERVSGAGDVSKLQRTVRELSADGPASNATRLGDAIRQVLNDFRGAPPAAIVLLTDGVATEGVPLSDAATEARAASVPMFSVGLGRSEQPRDVEIADVLVDDAVFVNDLVSFQVQVKATGLEGEPATVTLHRDDAETPIATQTITLPASGDNATVRLMDRPTTPGEVTYIVEIAPRDDESNKQNNRQERTVAVRDEKIRVLILYGYPSYEFRYIKALLERDPTVSLATYLQDADPDYAEQDKTALRSIPVSREELIGYDVIVVGDVDPRLVPRSVWQHMRSFAAEKGGGLAFIAGPRYFPWLYRDVTDVAALLPVATTASAAANSGQLPPEVSRGFNVLPTPLGLQSPAFQLGDTPQETLAIWRSLAPLYWRYESGDLKPAAHVLAKGANFPAITFQYVGAGRVLFHAIDSTWRWRLGAGDAYFARYWVQTVRFLARGKLTAGRGAELTADRREYTAGEPVEIRLRFRDSRLAAGSDEATVLLDSPGHARRRITLRRSLAADGLFTATVTDLPQGAYEATVAEPQIPNNPPATRFTIIAPPGELARPIMDAGILSAAAEQTRGKFYTITTAGNLLDELPAGRRVPIENLPPIPLWNRWWLLAAFLACLTTEWILRKRKGML